MFIKMFNLVTVILSLDTVSVSHDWVQSNTSPAFVLKVNLF